MSVMKLCPSQTEIVRFRGHRSTSCDCVCSQRGGAWRQQWEGWVAFGWARRNGDVYAAYSYKYIWYIQGSLVLGPYG